MPVVTRNPLLIPAFAASFFLTGCNTSAPPPSAAPATPVSSAASVTAPSFRLPEGSGCGGDVSRFRAVMDNDLATGHVNKGVYDRVTADINQAAGACQAGQDGAARSMISATKRKFGYPG
ncbi:MAG: hypothetical protein ACRCYS_08455 [Beijerinckiaceae bacterium]